jgi:hypothetical protein
MAEERQQQHLPTKVIQEPLMLEHPVKNSVTTRGGKSKGVKARLVATDLINQNGYFI